MAEKVLDVARLKLEIVQIKGIADESFDEINAAMPNKQKVLGGRKEEQNSDKKK